MSTADPHPSSVLQSLSLLAHRVRSAPAQAAAALSAGRVDVVLVDARTDLPSARELCRQLAGIAISAPVIAVAQEDRLGVVNADWRVDEIFLASAGPAEVDTRLRLSVGRRDSATGDDDVLILGELVIDGSTSKACVCGRDLDLRLQDFELLEHLARRAGQAFTRPQLLREVWGSDNCSNVRTVDAHVGRIRAKLGPEHHWMVATVRHVGYEALHPPQRPPQHMTA